MDKLTPESDSRKFQVNNGEWVVDLELSETLELQRNELVSALETCFEVMTSIPVKTRAQGEILLETCKMVRAVLSGKEPS